MKDELEKLTDTRNFRKRAFCSSQDYTTTLSTALQDERLFLWITFFTTSPIRRNFWPG